MTAKKTTPSCKHPDRALYALRMCRPCYEKTLRARNKAFAERQRTNAAEWGKRNQARKRALDSRYSKEVGRFKKYGITAAEYNRMLDAQGGVCLICKRSCSNRLALDHYHATGRVRGLLCVKCNCGLGNFCDNPDLLRAAIRYLEPDATPPPDATEPIA
jgi:hypothetical protein